MPCGSRFVYSQVIEDLVEAVKPYKFTLRIPYGYEVDVSRNKLCREALAGGYSHVFFVDSDVRLPKDALENLLSWKEDIILGYYSHRGQKFWDGKSTSLCKVNQIGFSDMITVNDISSMAKRGRRKIEIGGGGMGCALISRNALENIPDPWFHYRDRRSGDLSEDYWFCSQAKLSGFKIFADLRVACLHGSEYWEQIGEPNDRYEND